MGIDQQDMEDLRYLLDRFRDKAKDTGKSYKELVDEFFAYQHEKALIEQPKEPEKEEKPQEEPFELGDAGYSLLPKEVAEHAKNVIRDKSQVFIQTRCGEADHRYWSWGKNQEKYAFGASPYDTDFFQPLQKEKNVLALDNSKNTKVIMRREAVLPMMVTYAVKTIDPSGRSTAPAITFAMEKEDFDYFSNYLKSNPQHATPVFYGVPMKILNDNDPSFSRDEKKLIKGVEITDTFDTAIASIYYYCKYLPNFYSFEGGQRSIFKGLIDTNPVEIIDLLKGN